MAASGLAVAVWLPGRDDVASADVHGHDSAAQFGHSAFQDDFNENGLDRSKWSLLGDNGAPVDGGAQVSDGELQVDRLLRSRQRFTDAFGHAEARIKVRRENGVWRAFAVLDETGRVPQGTLETIDGGIDPTSGRHFHTYAIDWSPETVVWSVDGKPSLRLLRAQPGGPLTLVLNLATDGRSSTDMVVDFVRVFTSPTGPPTASPSEPSDSASPEPSDSASPPESPSPSPSESTSPEPTSPPESPSPSATPSATATIAAWAPFVAYQAGDLVTFAGATYRVLEAHTSLPGWEPTKLPELFAKV
ncbi:family 16 glycosylhydrolase [Actinoplanes sp. KI2]|uniref:carbohydrate-binding protein n=1 Tax=Actinoplanes sp. KI2 TaxID=2983315 RepID=UPI0021D59395|nr:carbohydrate-binding protein [Actinoplanes sp. KI2]MCU7724463.1 family 16 glycosylhydrolase [Actinoplanes sp. KI2]